MKTIIFDIDGTLVDISHRKHHIEKRPKDWKSFRQNYHLDKPNEPIFMLFKALFWGWDNNPESSLCFKLVCVSGRSEDEREVTEEWLKAHDLYPHGLHMRKSGDHRQDYIVKEEILKQLLNEGHDILFTIDDRKQVTDMWRRNGITCLQCAEGDF